MGDFMLLFKKNVDSQTRKSSSYGIKQIIDLHNHTLFGVDDGPKELDLSLEMLLEAEKQGISAIILTPHYRKGMFKFDKEKIQHNYVVLSKKCHQNEIKIQLYLGCEYHVNEQIFNNISSGRTYPLAGSDYILTEYKYETGFDEIAYTTDRLCSCSYNPIIAHVERYGCIQKKPKLCETLRDMGAMIQCNASAILGKEGKIPEKVTGKLLKSHLVDVVASDSHDMDKRKNNMREAAEYVTQKYGLDYAEALFYSNPLKVIESGVSSNIII